MPPKNPFARANVALWQRVNKSREWHKMPLPLALLNLRAFRDELRELNLYDTGEPAPAREHVSSAGLPKYRTYDGRATDPVDQQMGMVGTRFGRNVPIGTTFPEPMPGMLQPSPRDVSRALFNRDVFKPATTLNVLAAAWIQFQNHDWFGHGENSPTEFIDVPLGEGDDWGEDPMKVRRTHPDRTRMDGGSQPPTYVNTVTHWWDLSQIYGSDEERNRQLRAGEDGKMAVENGRLLNETEPGLDGVDLTGFNDNYWFGTSCLHTLFVLEHNAICDMLKASYPSWDDERLFLTARLINSAISARIHTVEWTPGILANPVLERAMHANWYGALPRWAKKVIGGRTLTEGLTGIIGSPLEHHAAPYAITEEFVSVYRLHPLIPDDYEMRDAKTGSLIDTREFTPMQGKGTRPTVDEFGMANLLYSIGVAHPGAITLHNHPRALQNFTRLNGDRLDLGTIDLLRDRERGVRRYNDFRERLRKPRVERFEDLTLNQKWNQEIREVYEGDIDRVDLQVGLLGEPLPKGFGFSDTAFRIFILMASRRLKSDRFFTSDYTPEVYTPEGLDWIEKTNMSDMIVRHYPDLAPAFEGVKNAFAPWKKLS